jgi:hypothetical protein
LPLINEHHAADAEQQTCRFAPGQGLAKEEGREQCREHRVRARNDRRHPGRRGLHADIVQAEIDRIVEDPQNGEHDEIAPVDAPSLAPQADRGQHDRGGQEKACGQQQQRRAVGKRQLGRREGGAPQQTKRHNRDRQRVETAAVRDRW